MYPTEEMPSPEKMLKGTTALGLSWKDGVILAADRRISAGTFMAGSLQKIYMITPKIGLCMAGMVSDAQSLVELMQAELKIYALENNHPPTVKTAGHLLAIILHGSFKRYMPYWTQLIIGGIDHTGNHIYSVDPSGGIHEETYTVIGSGTLLALGFLEAKYEEAKDVLKEAEKLAETALRMAISRDIATGNGIDMLLITNDGVEQKSIKL